LDAPQAVPRPPDGESPEGTPVTDAYALLYIASAARLDRKDGSLQIVMLADDGYVELAFASGGLSRVRVGFDESWPAGAATATAMSWSGPCV